MKKPYIIVVDAPDGKQATVLVNAAIDDYASKFKPNSGVINVNFADTKIMEGGVVVCTVSLSCDGELIKNQQAIVLVEDSDKKDDAVVLDLSDPQDLEEYDGGEFQIDGQDVLDDVDQYGDRVVLEE